MKKKLKVMFLLMLLCSGIFLLGEGKSVYAAEVGDVLTQPEEGWQRIDDSNSFIKFDSLWDYHNNAIANRWYYSTNHRSLTDMKGSSFKFKFKGTRFRIISTLRDGSNDIVYGSTEVSVVVDGVKCKNMTEYGPLTFTCLTYDLQGLSDGIHTVTITNMTTSYIWLDAIDIDKDGKMLNADLSYVSNVSLNKTNIDIETSESETLIASVLPEYADNKNLKWTSSNPSVCTVDENGKVTGVGKGNATVTALAKDESEISASCTVNVRKENTEGEATLEVYMDNGKEYAFNLTLDEISDFIEWFDGRGEGLGKVSYAIDTKDDNGKLKRKDYLRYDKISNYAVVYF